MPLHTILEDCAREALKHAEYEQLEDASFVGRVPELKGAIAFGDTRHRCEDELYSVVEDWAHLGMQRGFTLPVVGGVNLTSTDARKLAPS